MEDLKDATHITSDNKNLYQGYLQYDPSDVFKDIPILYYPSTPAKMETQKNEAEEQSDANECQESDTTSNNSKIEMNSLSILTEQIKKEPSYIFTHDKEFDFLMKAPRKKSTSLKIRKPAGECTQKKVVRFSDALGLELTSTRHVFDTDEPPFVPDSAMRDLNINLDVPLVNCLETKKLCLCFSSPENCPDFNKRLEEKSVMLENCLVDDSNNSVHGSIRVVNLAYEKDVRLRYSFNNWLTHDELTASYTSTNPDGCSDRFRYTIFLPDSFSSFNSLQFSVKYSANNQTFWDNNYGSNYRVECYTANKFY